MPEKPTYQTFDIYILIYIREYSFCPKDPAIAQNMFRNLTFTGNYLVKLGHFSYTFALKYMLD